MCYRGFLFTVNVRIIRVCMFCVLLQLSCAAPSGGGVRAAEWRAQGAAGGPAQQPRPPRRSAPSADTVTSRPSSSAWTGRRTDRSAAVSYITPTLNVLTSLHFWVSRVFTFILLFIFFHLILFFFFFIYSK